MSTYRPLVWHEIGSRRKTDAFARRRHHPFHGGDVVYGGLHRVGIGANSPFDNSDGPNSLRGFPAATRIVGYAADWVGAGAK